MEKIVMKERKRKRNYKRMKTCNRHGGSDENEKSSE